MAIPNKSVQSKIFTFRNFVFGMILGGGVYLILIIVSNWEQLIDYMSRIPVEIILTIFVDLLSGFFLPKVLG